MRTFKTFKKCKIESCNNRHKGLGFCEKHLERFRKFGDPLFTLIRERGAGHIDKKGYMVRYVKGRGLVPEHRLVMEQHLGRRLKWPEEVVHHINHKRMDNRIENLQLMTFKEHSLHHAPKVFPKKKT